MPSLRENMNLRELIGELEQIERAQMPSTPTTITEVRVKQAPIRHVELVGHTYEETNSITTQINALEQLESELRRYANGSGRIEDLITDLRIVRGQLEDLL